MKGGKRGYEFFGTAVNPEALLIKKKGKRENVRVYDANRLQEEERYTSISCSPRKSLQL